MSSLRQISENYLELANMLNDDEVDDDLIQALLDTLEATSGEFEIKAENY